MSFASYLEDIKDRLISDLYMFEKSFIEDQARGLIDTNRQKHIEKLLEICKKFSFLITDIFDKVLDPDLDLPRKYVELQLKIKEKKNTIKELESIIDGNTKEQEIYKNKTEVLKKEIIKLKKENSELKMEISRLKEKINRHLGYIKFINFQKGFGFIRGIDNQDIFFHFSDMEDPSTFNSLVKGQKVEYSIFKEEREETASMLLPNLKKTTIITKAVFIKII